MLKESIIQDMKKEFENDNLMTSMITEFFEKKSSNLFKIVNGYVEGRIDEVIKPKG